MVAKVFLTLAGIFGALGVAIGAFGAHALEGKLDERAIAIFETATRYQLIHALAIALVAFHIRPSLLVRIEGRAACEEILA